MAKPKERIEREMAQLKSAIATLATEFYQAYAHYTQHLGQAVRQQLILAAYHICTQSYPQEFLQLSLTTRAHLQETLKQLAQQAEEKIIHSLHKPTYNPKAIVAGVHQENSPVYEQEITADLPWLDDPQELAQWQETLEKSITEILEHFSDQANQELKKVQILSDELPEPLIEIAKQATSGHETLAAGPPNVLNLVIEAETFLNARGKGESKNSLELPEKLLIHVGRSPKQHRESGSPVIIGLQRIDEDGDRQEHRDEMTILPFSLPLKIVLVNLRLSDIEFSDPQVTLARNQLRHLQEQLRQQKQNYQRKQKEYAIAQAEAAWRSSWIEES